MRRKRERFQLNAEINVVSLIDVMMLLLVIFMITAPMMTGGVDVRLPVAIARPLDQKSSMVLTIDQNGTIFIGRDPLTYDEFSAAFRSLAGDAIERGVTVHSDGRASVDMLMKVMSVVREAGVTNVGFVTETPR
jgi:biopolymer transport protein ExbD/biopolymer transport protein TolR